MLKRQSEVDICVLASPSTVVYPASLPGHLALHACMPRTWTAAPRAMRSALHLQYSLVGSLKRGDRARCVSSSHVHGPLTSFQRHSSRSPD